MYRHATSVLETNRATIANELTRLESTLSYHKVNSGSGKITENLENSIQDLTEKHNCISAALAVLVS